MKALLLAVCVAAACTDAQTSSLAAFGEPGRVTCYSGGEVIYQGISTGRISSTAQSDGWEFKDSKTGKFVRVSGDCVIEN